MSYLLDKKIKKKKILYIIYGIIFCLVLFYFRLGIFNGLSVVSHTLFGPILSFGDSISGKIGSLGSFFSSKNSLYIENQILKSELDANNALLINYDSIVVENSNLKEILGRKDEKVTMVLSAILAKPNQSPYDTLVIDVGANKNIKKGEMVFALGNVPIGRVSDVYSNSAKVVLFSSPGERTEVVITGKNVFMEVVGRGGGNFELILPRDLSLFKGDQAVLPGIFPFVLGIVETIVSDPRDPFIKALLTSPVNIQELKFVEVEIVK